MALSKAGTNALGILATGALLAGTWFFGVSPLQEQTKAAESQTQAMKISYTEKMTNLSRLQEGSIDVPGVTAEGEKLNSLFATDVDIESASRAISNAVGKSNVSLQSFNFGSAESVTAKELAEVKLDGFSEPFSKSSKSKEKTPEEGEEGAETETANPSGGLQRVPVTIEVSVDGYNDLSGFLDALAKENRLMLVVGVQSSGASATVYAYTYFAPPITTDGAAGSPEELLRLLEENSDLLPPGLQPPGLDDSGEDEDSSEG